MTPIDYFVPDDPEPGHDDEVLSRLRWPISPGVIRAYVEAYTRPGDAVLLPYGQGAAEVREVLRLGRRPLAVHYDPLMVLLIEAALAPTPAGELDAAVTRLGDSRKQGVPLRRYVDELYAASCPACMRPAVADYFVWEQGLPVTKHLRCPGCEWEGEAGIERGDLQPLADIPPRGMHYHYILDRVAPGPQANELRARLEPLLDLYTPRTLAALADLTLKIEALPAGVSAAARRTLWVLLLDCLDRGSVLEGRPDSTARRRGLARPPRFVERNVWRLFEAAAARARSWAALPPVADGLGPGRGLVGRGAVRDLARLLPEPATLPLILVSPPPLDLAAWSLSYLWGAWLLGIDAVAPLRPLLRLRTPDTAWYARVLAGSFRTLAGRLAPDGRLALVVKGQRAPVVDALVWSAARAGLQTATLLQAGADYRLELAPAPPAARPDRAALESAAREAIAEAIRARGEPTPTRTLQAAVQRRLSQSGLLPAAARGNGEGGAGLDEVAAPVQRAWERPGLVRLETETGAELWWLARSEGASPPLADRVEAVVHAVLEKAGDIDEADLAREVYTRLPGPLTPDPALIAACLRAYATAPAGGCWRLRPEDRTEAREEERRKMTGLLLELGERLGYRARETGPLDVAWLDGRQTHAAFAVRWQAAVGPVLAPAGRGTGRGAARGAHLYLVVPGGRAALLSFKLAHNPLWREALDRGGWRFIKYRHVRQLAAEPEVDEYALRAIVGLDPIVEHEAVQMPLF